MRHIRSISWQRPAKAQFESILQLVGLVNTLLSLYVNVANTFGIPVPQWAEKNGAAGDPD